MKRRERRKRNRLGDIAMGAAAVFGMLTIGHAEDPAQTVPADRTQPLEPAKEAAPVAPPVAVPADADIVYDEVVVTGEKGYKPENSGDYRRSEPIRDIPQTITVIPKEVIEDQGATTLRDVLRNVPGISMQAGEGGVPAGDNLSIRGFNARTDIFVDGLRDIGGYFRDPFNSEQVEVTKGPSSSEAGRGSTGGSVNIVSKTPRRTEFVEGSAGVGTDEYTRVTADLNKPLGEHVGFRLNALFHENETPRRDEVMNRRWGLAPTLLIGQGTKTRLTLGYTHLDQDNTPDYGIPWVPATNNALRDYRDQPAPVDLENFYGILARDHESTVTDIGDIRLERDLGDWATVRNQTRYGENDRDSVITAPRFVNDNTTNINRQLQSRDQVDRLVSNVTSIAANAKTGDVGHAIVAGVELTQEDSRNYARMQTANAPVADLYDPNPHAPFAGAVTRNGSYTKAQAKTVAAFAYDTLKFGDHWEVPIGARWDSFDINYSSFSPNGVEALNLSRTDRMLSYKGGIVYKPVEEGSIYASYGTSFNPSAEGLTLATTATAANNVNTKPEESRTYEIGTKWDLLKKRLQTSFAIFRTDKTNARTEDPNNALDVIVLDGEQRVQGLELGAGGGITENWNMFAAYTYLDSEVRASRNAGELGKELTNTPRNSWSFWSSYQLPFRVQVGAGAQYVGSRYGNTVNTRRVESYWLFDALVSYQATDKVGLRLNVYNAADEEYYGSIGGGHLIPGAGRSATLTTDVRF